MMMQKLVLCLLSAAVIISALSGLSITTKAPEAIEDLKIDYATEHTDAQEASESYEKDDGKDESLSSGEAASAFASASRYANVSSDNDTFSFSEEALDEITGVIQGCGDGVSVFYRDIESGYTYTYNEDQKYFIASLIKAPYCMYLYTLVSKGEVDLDTVLTYAERHYHEGTGLIQEMEYGVSFTVRELIGYAIKYSDNVAINMLTDIYPASGYVEWTNTLDLNYPEDAKSGFNANITVADAGVYIEAIYNFINENEYGGELKELMLSTLNPMIVSSYPVIRKYGWSDEFFHDMAIVEAPRPYLLAICTNHDGDYYTFTKISNVIEKYAVPDATDLGTAEETEPAAEKQ